MNQFSKNLEIAWKKNFEEKKVNIALMKNASCKENISKIDEVNYRTVSLFNNPVWLPWTVTFIGNHLWS